MSRTVSFRASVELDEFLEQEAERRMTTKSTVSQMLLAERVRQLQDERGDGDDLDGEAVAVPEDDGESSGDDLAGLFQKHPEKWYQPDGMYDYAVYVDDGNDRQYYKTERGAKKRLKREYE